jgi:hypothetical protein
MIIDQIIQTKHRNLSGEMFSLDDASALFVDVDAFASTPSYRKSSISGTIPTYIYVDIFLSETLTEPKTNIGGDSMNAQMRQKRETATVKLHLKITEHSSRQ